MRYRSPHHACAATPGARPPEKQSQHIMENESLQKNAVQQKKTKRFRSAFTTEQIKYLDAEFRKYPYIGSARRKEVSNALNIPERAVKIWFQNRRMKEKKDIPSAEPDSDEHKNSRKADFGNDQLSNECTVTSSNNQNYAPLPLISPKISKNAITVSIPIKKANEKDPTNKERPVPKTDHDTNKSSAEFSIELFKQYNHCIGKREEHVRPSVAIEATSQPGTQYPKNEVSSTSPYDKLPQDLSRKRKQPPQDNLNNAATEPESLPGGYFPLNLKKYCVEPSPPVGGVVWKPVPVMPLVGAPAPPQVAGCRCDCRCRPPAAPAPLLQGGTVPQYVLTAFPLQTPLL